MLWFLLPLVGEAPPLFFVETRADVFNSSAAIDFNKYLWDEVVDAIKKGQEPESVVIKKATEAAPPPPPGVAIELPYETSLSISGRKTIDGSFRFIKITPEKARETGVPEVRSDFILTQSLQVRILGTVGRKVTVNVDFDDTKPDKRDISVVYKGDPDEFVQEVAFGDVVLSLPSTEFAGYSKQVFGIRGYFRYRTLNIWAIASRTKGQTETKRFTGNITFVKKEISDISYIRRKYYDVAFSTPIKPASEEIWMDDLNASNDTAFTATMTVEYFQISGSSYTGRFDRLNPGVDYFMDYAKGLVIFNRTIPSNAVLAINYVKSDGSELKADTGLLKIFKDQDESTDTLKNREVKQFYSFGDIKIVRDDGRGNFIMKILDDTRVERQDIGKYPDDIAVDFELGIFEFKKKFPSQGVYDRTPTTAGFKFYTEYRTRVKTYMLRPGIVPLSERIVMDGVVLKKDIDYFIDYESGFLTFFDESKITENTVIEASYEVAPFGGLLGETVLGGRVSYQFSKFAIGFTALGSFTPQLGRIPDARNLPSSLTLYDADFSIGELKTPLFFSITGISGEVARSYKNPNTFGKAMVESMDGITSDETITTNRTSYYPKENFNIDLGNSTVNEKDMNPNISALDASNVQTLDVVSTAAQTKIVVSLSKLGVDLSKKEFMRFWIYGDGSGANMKIGIGVVGEDLDDDNILDTEDTNGNGILDTGEDTGINLGGVKWGAGNGVLDTEDLDGDGRLTSGGSLEVLDISEGWLSFNPVSGVEEVITKIDFSGWRSIRIPLKKTPALKVVKTLEFFFDKPINIKLSKIAISGLRWEPVTVFGSGSSTMTVKNNIDTLYTKLPDNILKDIYGEENAREKRFEQAVVFEYSLNPEASFYTRITYITPVDFSQHHYIKYYIYGKSITGSEEVSVRIGGSNDYWEIRTQPVLASWYEVVAELVDENNDQVPEKIRALDSRSRVVLKGNPSLTQVSVIQAGVVALSTATGEVWLNEMHLSSSRQRTGQASRLSAGVTIPGWMNTSGSIRKMDRRFETLTQQILNRDVEDINITGSITRFRFLPLSGGVSFSRVITPSAFETKDPNLVSILEEGETYSRRINAGGSFDVNVIDFGRYIIGRKLLPISGISFSGQESYTKSNILQREDISRSVNASTEFKFPRIDLIPGRFFFHPIPNSYSISGSLTKNYLLYFKSRKDLISSTDTASVFANAELIETSYNYSIGTSWQIVNFLSLTPNYSFSKTTEERIFKEDAIQFSPGLKDAASYPKRQAHGFSSGVLINFPLFSPSISYRANINETNNLPLVTDTTAYTLKTVDRSITLDTSITLSGYKIAGWLPVFNKFNFAVSNSIGKGDVYENIEYNRDMFPFLFDASSILKDSGRLKTLTLRNSERYSGTAQLFSDIITNPKAEFIKRMNLTLTLTKNVEHTEQFDSFRDVISLVWPDLIIQTGGIERIFNKPFFSDSSIQWRYSERFQETVKFSRRDEKSSSGDFSFSIFGSLRPLIAFSYTEFVDVNLQFNRKNASGFSMNNSLQLGFFYKKVSITTRGRYSKDFESDSLERATRDSNTAGFDLSMYYDTIPESFLFFKDVKAQRLVANLNAGFTRTSSSVNVGSTNIDTYTLGGGLEYTIGNNLRASMGLSSSMNKNRVIPKEDILTLEIKGGVVLQF